MIGVIAKSSQVEVVEEFFELFKTPWEFYRKGSQYDVVVATDDTTSEIATTLLIIYGAGAASTDSSHGFIVASRCRGGSVDYHGTLLPIYGELAKFETTPTVMSCLKTDTQVVGLRAASSSGKTILRVGYDLFDEVRSLMCSGQPMDSAGIPTLDIHIAMLREWIVEHDIALLEILPTPAGHSFSVCLTHDIDFVGIRHHKFDHTMFGFLYRSSFGAIGEWLRGKISVARVLGIWRAVISLPFVYLGWMRDFWEPFEWYLQAEKGLPATYFLIPFKRRAGEHVPGPHAARRAAAYEVGDLAESIHKLKRAGCELGVHGLDAWHSADKGRTELARIASTTGESGGGIRMHWLLRDENTFRVLEESGYKYDSTAGYNETIGFLNGTTQVFRPLGVRTLLELPMHIQDGALFFPERLDLSESEAWKRCEMLIGRARQLGGVLTLLWHDRSHGPERFWGDFYERLLLLLRSSNPWFGTAAQVTTWFQHRRNVRFQCANAADNTVPTCLRYVGTGSIHPPLNVRVHLPRTSQDDEILHYSGTGAFLDVAWKGDESQRLNDLLQKGLLSQLSGA